MNIEGEFLVVYMCSSSYIEYIIMYIPPFENERMAPKKELVINRNIIPTVKFQEIC